MDFSHNVFGLGLKPNEAHRCIYRKMCSRPRFIYISTSQIGLFSPQVLTSRNMLWKFETHKILLDTTTVMTHTILSSLLTYPPCHRPSPCGLSRKNKREYVVWEVHIYMSMVQQTQKLNESLFFFFPFFFKPKYCFCPWYLPEFNFFRC